MRSSVTSTTTCCGGELAIEQPGELAVDMALDGAAGSITSSR
jgi:hypothetical protein